MATTIGCKRCHDLGKCALCKGRGKVTIVQADGFGTAYRRVRCETCFGTGKCLACQPVAATVDPIAVH